jgi:hypothetical protein
MVTHPVSLQQTLPVVVPTTVASSNSHGDPDEYYWSKAYYEIIDRYGQVLKPYGLAVYDALCRHADRHTRRCYPSYQRLAKELGISRRKVIYVMHHLEALGLVAKASRRTQDGDSDSNEYMLLEPWLQAEDSGGDGVQRAPGDAQHASGVVPSVHRGGAQCAPKQESLNKSHLEQEGGKAQSCGETAPER